MTEEQFRAWLDNLAETLRMISHHHYLFDRDDKLSMAIGEIADALQATKLPGEE